MEIFDSLSEIIQSHVKLIAKTSGMPITNETYELLASAWAEKKDCFEDVIAENNLEEVTYYSLDEPKGALVLTYSGSLLNIGPLVDGKRRVEYSSIGLRTDVPKSAAEANSVLSSDIEIDTVVVFSKGPIQQSSPVYKIVLSQENLDAKEDAELLTRVTEALTEEFIEVNKTIIQ